MIIKKHLTKKQIEEIVEKIEKLGYRRVEEKHEALVHRYDTNDGIIKIYKKMKKEDDYTLIITGSTEFESKINNYLFQKETQESIKETKKEAEIIIGIDESGVSSYQNFIVSGVSYQIFDLIDSKKINKNTLEQYFADILANSEFLAIFKFHTGLLNYIRRKGYAIGDIVNAIAKALSNLFESIGIKTKILIDGDKPKNIQPDPKIEYLGKKGELKDRNVAAAGVVSTYLRRAINPTPHPQPPEEASQSLS